MITKTFIEKYPEFKELEVRWNKVRITKLYNKSTTIVPLIEKTIEEILDKHFVRKKEILNTVLHLKSETEARGYDHAMEKVKDVIDKAMKENQKWSNSISRINRQSVVDVDAYLLDLKKSLEVN